MNTYDPSDYIRYVTMDRPLDPSPVAGAGVEGEQRLPNGYANASPATRLRNRSAARVSDVGRRPRAVPGHAGVR